MGTARGSRTRQARLQRSAGGATSRNCRGKVQSGSPQRTQPHQRHALSRGPLEIHAALEIEHGDLLASHHNMYELNDANITYDNSAREASFRAPQAAVAVTQSPDCTASLVPARPPSVLIRQRQQRGPAAASRPMRRQKGELPLQLSASSVTATARLPLCHAPKGRRAAAPH